MLTVRTTICRHYIERADFTCETYTAGSGRPKSLRVPVHEVLQGHRSGRLKEGKRVHFSAEGLEVPEVPLFPLVGRSVHVDHGVVHACRFVDLS